MWKRMPLKCYIRMCLLFLFFFDEKNKVLSGKKNNVVVFPFPFHIFMPLANLSFILLQGEFSIVRIRSFPDLYPLIYPPRRSLALDRGRILIPGFIRSPPTLAVYDVAYSPLLGGIGRDFPFTEKETRRHFSYLSGTFREYQSAP